VAIFYSHELTFSRNFESNKTEVAIIGRCHTLLNPRVQYFYAAGE
jgi:hypothetical protein